MPIKRIEINHVRNIAPIAIEPSEKFNIFYGKNGSGKTSLLEAIYVLGLGKSFRHHLLDTITQHNASSFSVIAQVNTASQKTSFPVGIEKTKQGKLNIRISREACHSSAKLAELLPIQLIHPESDELISGSPRLRRNFIDWGLFHVEQTFFSTWKKLQKIIKQRNAALKLRQPKEQVFSWDEEYVSIAEMITMMRSSYIDSLRQYFTEMINYFFEVPLVDFLYRPGVEGDQFREALKQNYYKDLQLGYTQLGPQRDDLFIHMDALAASDVLSRGEQKLVVIAMKLAQGRLLREITQKPCLFMLDDFGAELDAKNRQKVIEVLNQLDSQVFLTTIDIDEVKEVLKEVNPLKFYVEEGRVKQV